MKRRGPGSFTGPVSIFLHMPMGLLALEDRCASPLYFLQINGILRLQWYWYCAKFMLSMKSVEKSGLAPTFLLSEFQRDFLRSSFRHPYSAYFNVRVYTR